MAEQRLTSHVGDAIVALLDWAWPQLRGRARRVLEHIIEAAKPDPPMTLRTLDGMTFTGVVVADRGQVLIFLGTRLPATNQPRYYDDEPSFWGGPRPHR